MERDLSFIERVEVTPTAASFRFSRPRDLDFVAGQYMLVEVGPGLIHPLSLSDCPAERGFVEFTKRMTGSAYCERLLALKSGERIKVRGPQGSFVVSDRDGGLVFIVGGIGITPIRSILKEMVATGAAPTGMLLLYGNRDREDIAFADELAALSLPGFRMVNVLEDPAGMAGAWQGFISPEIIREEVADLPGRLFMVSGPPVMVKAVGAGLASLGVDEGRVRTDVFAGYE